MGGDESPPQSNYRWNPLSNYIAICAIYTSNGCHALRSGRPKSRSKEKTVLYATFDRGRTSNDHNEITARSMAGKDTPVGVIAAVRASGFLRALSRDDRNG